jgi:starch-binding outer membrane protein SusE/F
LIYTCRLRSCMRSVDNALILFTFVLLIACREDEPGQAPLDIGLLSASSSEVIVDYDTPTEEAVTFSWKAEKTAAIHYQLAFTSGARSYAVDVLSEVSKTFTHAELNKILVDQLQLEIGEAASVDVAALAKVTTSNKTGSSNVITISVTPSPKIIEPTLEGVTLSVSRLAAVMDNANPSGETMTFVWGEDRNIFIQYKLVLTSGSKSASVDLLTDVSKEFTNGELNDILIDKLQLGVGSAANVNVVVNATITISGKTVSSNSVTISVTPSVKVPVAPAHTQLWVVGSATPNGWDIGNPNVMIKDPVNIYQFKFNEILNEGEFKIPVTTGNWGADYYMPLTNHPALSNTSVKLIPGGNPDNKWNIENPGAYKILLNISSNPFIEIVPFTPYENIYIIGDATAAGWDANSPVAMTVDPGDTNVFTWTGELKSTGRGQFRFLLATGDLNGSAFVAPTSNASLNATQLAFTPEGGPANNFKVKAGEDGVYKIVINQLKETISIVKQ